MPWEGYNYEDAIIINERLVSENILTSIHLVNFNVLINSNDILTNNLNITNDSEYNIKYKTFLNRNLNKLGIIKIGSYVQENDVLIGKVLPTSCKLENQLYNLIYKKKETEQSYIDNSFYLPKGLYGKIINIKIISSKLLPNNTPGYQKIKSKHNSVLKLSY